MELQNLKKELPYKWRVQSINQYNAVCVAYIDSRDVQDLLDEVVGAENWQSDYKEVKGNVYAGVAILINGQWVWKWDCGVESKTEAEKGEASDSFKRAAVKWGIGRFLYSLEIKKLRSVQYKDKWYPATEKSEIIWNGDELTDYLNGKKQPPPKQAEIPKQPESPTESELKLLYDLANRIQDEEQRQKAYNSIKTCKDYGMYQKIQHRLEDLQPHIDQIPNPSQTDIKRHLQKTLA